MNKLDIQYQDLLKDVLSNGVKKDDRTGTGTVSVFGRMMRHKMSDGFPLLTTKKMFMKTCMTELKWFLRGDTNIKYLVDNKCNIWNGDAYKKYEKYAMANSYGVDVLSIQEFIEQIKTDDEFAEKWGDLGPIYGYQWRSWTAKTTRDEKITNPGVYVKHIDQIKWLVNELNNNPDSRRLMVNAWNVSDLPDMTLPPCHYGFQVYTQVMSLKERRFEWAKSLGKHESYAKEFDHKELDAKGFPTRRISLKWDQRSVDTFLGLPFDIASYGMLLHLIAMEVNMIPDELTCMLGDVHIYNNHMEAVNTLLARQSKNLPKLTKLEGSLLDGEFEYEIEGYDPHPAIKAPLSN